MSDLQNITVLGSTGSIGKNTLDVVARHPDRFRVFALTAATQVDLMAEQCARFAPRYAVMAAEEPARRLRERLRALGVASEVLHGDRAPEQE